MMSTGTAKLDARGRRVVLLPLAASLVDDADALASLSPAQDGASLAAVGGAGLATSRDTASRLEERRGA